MRILIPGATGAVGGHLVEQALAKGHEVIALARSADRLAMEHRHLKKVSADILDPESITPWLEGVDAVVSAVGIGASRKPTTLYSRGTKNLINGMEAHGVSRIIVISSEVAEHWAHQRPFKLWVILPLLQKYFGATYDDMRRMDIVLWESRTQWTAVRAPRIRAAKANGHYRLSSNGPIKRGWSVSASDLATALLDVLEREDLGRKHVYVAS